MAPYSPHLICAYLYCLDSARDSAQPAVTRPDSLPPSAHRNLDKQLLRTARSHARERTRGCCYVYQFRLSIIKVHLFCRNRWGYYSVYHFLYFTAGFPVDRYSPVALSKTCMPLNAPIKTSQVPSVVHSISVSKLHDFDAPTPVNEMF